MKYSTILRELTKRKVQNISDAVMRSKEESLILRSRFIQSIIDSDGEVLKKYYEFTNDPYEPIKSVDIFRHIKTKSGLTFSNTQLGAIKFYLQKQGAKIKKRTDAYFFTNIKLKD